MECRECHEPMVRRGARWYCECGHEAPVEGVLLMQEAAAVGRTKELL